MLLATIPVYSSEDKEDKESAPVAEEDDLIDFLS